MNPLTASIPNSSFSVLTRLVVLVLLAGLGIAIYLQWDAFVAATIEWQKSLHEMLASHIGAVSENALNYGGALIALSFGYGVFHAVGPGHGKAVITTYLGTNKESIGKGILISFAAAILQSVIAILLVSALARTLKFKLAEVHNYGNDMALASYVLVMMLGVMLVISSIRRLFRLKRSRQQTAFHDDHHNDGHAHQRAHSHSHDSDCGCSHSHVPEKNASIWQTLTVILSMGFRPCSGAIVVLIYAHLVGVYSYGVMATLMMGIGTGLSVSLIAVATLFARNWLERFAAETSENRFFASVSVSHYVRLLGGAILVVLGWSFYSTATAISAGHPLF